MSYMDVRTRRPLISKHYYKIYYNHNNIKFIIALTNVKLNNSSSHPCNPNFPK